MSLCCLLNERASRRQVRQLVPELHSDREAKAGHLVGSALNNLWGLTTTSDVRGWDKQVGALISDARACTSKTN